MELTLQTAAGEKITARAGSRVTLQLSNRRYFATVGTASIPEGGGCGYTSLIVYREEVLRRQK